MSSSGPPWLSGGGTGSSSAPPWAIFGQDPCHPTAPYTDLNHTILSPAQGATFIAGQQLNISWQAGLADELVIRNGPPWAGGWSSKTSSWSISLLGEGGGIVAVILDNATFEYGVDVSWTTLADCSNTAINQTWRIPSSFTRDDNNSNNINNNNRVNTSKRQDETVFKLAVVNVTDPDPASQSTTTESPFTILPESTSAPLLPSSSSSSLSTATKSSTISKLTAADIPPPTATTGGPQGPGASAAPSTSSSPSSSDQSDMSAGAKAGIAIGAVSALALLLLAMFFCWRHRRQRSSPAAAAEAEAVLPTELDAHDNTLHQKLASTSPATSSDTPSRYATGLETEEKIVTFFEMPQPPHPHRDQGQLGLQQQQQQEVQQGQDYDESPVDGYLHYPYTHSTKPSTSTTAAAAAEAVANTQAPTLQTIIAGLATMPATTNSSPPPPPTLAELPGYIPHSEMPASPVPNFRKDTR